MAQTAVTFRCGHTGTLPVDEATAKQIIAQQADNIHWRNLCPQCRSAEDVGAGGGQ